MYKENTMNPENKKLILDLLETELMRYCRKVMEIADKQGLPLNTYEQHEYYQDLSKAIKVLEDNI